MKTKNLFCVIISFFSMITNTFGQSVEDLKQQMNSIKKSQEYIYGQAAGEDEEASYAIAYEIFMQKFKEYIHNNSVLKEAEAVIMPTIKTKVKKISFERHINSKVVCLYVNKNDILPLFEKDIVFVNKIKPDTLIQTIQNNMIQVSERDSSEIIDMLNTSLGTTDSIINKDVKYVSSVKSKDGAITNNKIDSIERVPQDSIVLHITIKDEKAYALLNEIIFTKNYDDVKKVLEYRKASIHDIMYKATMNFDVKNAYWAIFDKHKKMIALLDRNKNIDIMTQQEIDYKQFITNPKIWIQIY